MKFAPKLALLLSLLFLITGASVSYFIYTSTTQTLEKAIGDKLEEQSFHIMDKIDRMLFERQKDLKALLTCPVLSSKNSTPEQIAKRLKEYKKEQKIYSSISFFDMNRVRIADTTGKDIGKQRLFVDYWKDISEGKEFVVDIFRSLTLNAVTFHFVQVVKDKDGIPFGVIVARSPVEELYEIIKAGQGIHKYEEVFKAELLSKNGLILYSTFNKEGILKDITPDWAVVKEFISSGKTLSSKMHFLAGENELTAFAREQGYKEFKGNDWVLIMCAPVKTVFAPAVELRNRVIFIFLFIWFLATISIVIFSSVISRPILKLRRAAAKIGAGDLNERVKVTSKDEIGQLAGSFNRMAEDLGKYIRQNELILNSAGEGIFGLDIQGNHTFVNPAAAKMLGYEIKELIGRHSHTLWHHTKEDGTPYPQEECPIYESIKKGLMYHRVRDEVFWRKDGSSFPASYTSTPIIENSRITGAVVTFIDISNQRKADQLLRESEDKYRTLVEKANDGIAIIQNSIVKFVNQRLAELWGGGIEEIIGTQFVNYIAPEELPKVAERYKRRMAGEYLPPIFETMLRKKDNSVVFAETNASIITYEGKPAEFVIVRDITERKLIEAQLLQAQKMEAIGQLAGGVAHDFNNILTAIIGYGHVLAMKLSENETLRRHAEQILVSADRAAKLTKALLAFSRKQVMSLQPTDINEIIQEVQNLLTRLIPEHIEIKTELTKEDVTVLADAGQMEQVLMNLATNAKDAMPDGGLLTITTSRKEIDAGSISAHKCKNTGHYALISVSDTGAGMDEATMTRIFEPFFTTKEAGRGTGLGLAMVYGIIEQHNGCITVKSELGKGSTFNICLPLLNAELGMWNNKEREIPQSSFSIPQPKGETILIAEDEEMVRNLHASGLQGYRVIEAKDGDDALRQFLKHKDEIHLFISDVVMPKKSGREAYEEMKKLKPGLRVLFMSGHAEELIDKKGIIEHGFHFIAKPANPNVMLKKVREILDSSS